jgi:hypothetical protein
VALPLAEKGIEQSSSNESQHSSSPSPVQEVENKSNSSGRSLWCRSTPPFVQEVELTDDAVDASLRALEELLANPSLSPRVVHHPGLVPTLLGLLQVPLCVCVRVCVCARVRVHVPTCGSPPRLGVYTAGIDADACVWGGWVSGCGCALLAPVCVCVCVMLPGGTAGSTVYVCVCVRAHRSSLDAFWSLTNRKEEESKNERKKERVQLLRHSFCLK